MTLSAHPIVSGTTYMAVSGDPAAFLAGSQILEAGGNAVDAGVAIGLCMNVLESEMTGFAGVAPAMLRMAADGEVRNFVGVGPWPKIFGRRLFSREPRRPCPTRRPRNRGAGRTGYLTHRPAEVRNPQLQYGCRSRHMLGARRLPNVPIHGRSDAIALRRFQRIAGDGGNLLAGRGLPKSGDLFVQADRAHAPVPCGRGAGRKPWRRDAGIDAARRAFYEGDIAAAIVKQQEEQGGFMIRDDLASFRAEIEKPTRARFGNYELYGCGPWCQGPMIIGAAQILSNMDLARMGHNSAETIHAVAEALKLSAANREAYFGDPAQMEVPLDTLLDPAYSRGRRDLIQDDHAHPGLPDHGRVDGFDIPAWQPDPSSGPQQSPANPLETSYFCVIDKDGNLFSATLSDPTISGEVVPGLGITTSRWGTRAHTGAHHPARVGPG